MTNSSSLNSRVMGLMPAALLGLLLALAACQSSPAGASESAAASSPSASVAEVPGEPSGEATPTSVYDLEVDDCWRGSSTNVLEVDVVPCEQPHTYQVFLVTDYPGEEFPGAEELATAAEEECLAAFSDYVGSEYEESEFAVHYLAPSETTWSEGDREIVCSLSQQDDGEWTGSGKDSGR